MKKFRPVQIDQITQLSNKSDSNQAINYNRQDSFHYSSGLATNEYPQKTTIDREESLDSHTKQLELSTSISLFEKDEEFQGNCMESSDSRRERVTDRSSIASQPKSTYLDYLASKIKQELANLSGKILDLMENNSNCTNERAQRRDLQWRLSQIELCRKEAAIDYKAFVSIEPESNSSQEQLGSKNNSASLFRNNSNDFATLTPIQHQDEQLSQDLILVSETKPKDSSDKIICITSSPAKDYTAKDFDFEDDLNDFDLSTIDALQNDIENNENLWDDDWMQEIDQDLVEEDVPDINIPTETYQWTPQVMEALQMKFKLKTFRTNQLNIINTTLAGDDCFVLMPTGGGKSLCYQLPALVSTGKTRGVTIVVSPLISLIQDQVTRLISLGIPALYIIGDLTAEQRRWAYSELNEANPNVKLAYVTPELIMRSPQFQSVLKKLYSRKLIARFVIDEAHCVSQWGHDFRPDYKEMSVLRKLYPNVPLLALTATANDKVKIDILHVLGIPKAKVFQQSFNRPNLRYEIRPKDNTIHESIKAFIQTYHPNESGIIYCSSRKNCEEMNARLSTLGISNAFYHAGLDKDDRTRIQQEWGSNKIQVIIATVAFGMGIDKPDVRFVIHHSLPQSLEGYYQETGRAGRDGKHSQCILFYSYGDKKTIDFLIDRGDGNEDQKERQRANLAQVIQFCENKVDCRRAQVLSYFGETFNPAQCKGTCDNCQNKVKVTIKNISSQVIDLINLTKKLLDPPVTMHYLIDVYRGSKVSKIRNASHDQLKEFGKGSGMKKSEVERICHFLISKNILQEYYLTNRMGFCFGYIKNYRSYEAGSKDLKFSFYDEAVPAPKQKDQKKSTKRKVTGNNNQEFINSYQESKKLKDKNEKVQNEPPKEVVIKENKKPDKVLYSKLVETRNNLVAKYSVPPSKIFTDMSLTNIASKNPKTQQEFMNTSRISEKRHWDLYGQELFKVCQDHQVKSKYFNKKGLVSMRNSLL